MCAINGVTKNDRALVELMNEATRHRGPDGSRIWEGEGITLGHNRLAVIDLSDRALQPMEGAHGRYQIVFNGEIYNYRELREELKAYYQFKTESDTEVLIAAYHIWGTAMFPRLRGMFAFGIWNTEEETLLLARDQMGIKPLYYSKEHASLTFSSELSAFTSHGKNELSKEGLSLYLEFQYVPSPHTLIEGVYKLPPGHLIRYSKGEFILEQYYRPESGVGIPEEYAEDERVTTERLYNGIDAAVKRQLISDRPIGMFLSGGLDSSIVLHHMSQHASKVQTFSVNFEMVAGAEAEESKFNTDAHLAEKTAGLYGAHHTTYTLTLEEIRSACEEIMASLDEPVANPTALSQYFLSKRVREDGVVVALGGDGGDELFLGYTRHRMLMASYYFKHLPGFMQSGLAHLHPRVAKLRIPFGAPIHLSVMANKEKTITPFIQGVNPYEFATKYFNEKYVTMPHGHHPLETFMYVDRSTWLPEESLHRTDRSGMAHGLEMRVPLIDLEVTSLADRIPVAEKLTPFEGKRVLRDLYRSHLPEYLFNQPKRGWVSPGAKWLRDPKFHDFVQHVLSSEYYDGLSELYKWDAIQELLRAHVEKKTYALYPLWNLLVLQIWARKNGVVYKG